MARGKHRNGVMSIRIMLQRVAVLDKKSLPVVHEICIKWT